MSKLAGITPPPRMRSDNITTRQHSDSPGQPRTAKHTTAAGSVEEPFFPNKASDFTGRGGDSPTSPLGSPGRRGRRSFCPPGPGMDLIVGEELDDMLQTQERQQGEGRQNSSNYWDNDGDDGFTATGGDDPGFTQSAPVRSGGGTAPHKNNSPSYGILAGGNGGSSAFAPPSKSATGDKDKVVGLSPHGLAPKGLPMDSAPALVRTAPASPSANFPRNPQRVPSPPTPSRKKAKQSSAAKKLQASMEAADATHRVLEEGVRGESRVDSHDLRGGNRLDNESPLPGVVGFVSSGTSSDGGDGGFTASGTNFVDSFGGSSSMEGSLLYPSNFRSTRCNKPPLSAPHHIPLLKRLSGVDAAVDYSRTKEGREEQKRRNTNPQQQIGFIAPGVFKKEQKVAALLDMRMKRKAWLDKCEEESFMSREAHRVGLHMMASEAFRWNKERTSLGRTSVKMPKQFMRGLRHDFNLLLGPQQEKDRYHAALQATIALKLWHPPPPPGAEPVKSVSASGVTVIPPATNGRRSTSTTTSSRSGSRSNSRSPQPAGRNSVSNSNGSSRSSSRGGSTTRRDTGFVRTV